MKIDKEFNYICAHCGNVVSGKPDINPCKCNQEWLEQPCKPFDKLIRELYKLRKKGAGFAGILYTALSSVGFQRIDDLDEFIEKYKPDMLLLKSMEDETEIEVYRSNLEDYHVDKSERTLYIKLKDKPEEKIKF